MSTFFNGRRYNCTAHYALLADQVVGLYLTADERDDFLEAHGRKANVAVETVEWSLVSRGYQMHKAAAE